MRNKKVLIISSEVVPYLPQTEQAVKSFQSGAKATETVVSWIGKKGKEMTKRVKLPLGRSKKVGK